MKKLNRLEHVIIKQIILIWIYLIKVQEFTHIFNKMIMEEEDYREHGPDDSIELKVNIYFYLIVILRK